MKGDGTGTSVATADKQDGFRKYLRLHARIVQHIWHKWPSIPRVYLYIDTHCGSGEAGQYGPGSPLIFLDVIEQLGLPFQAHFIDEVPANIEALRARMNGRKSAQSCSVYAQQNQGAIGPILNTVRMSGSTFGLLYMDPFGLPSDFIQPVLSRVASRVPRVDLLVRIPTSGFKRARHAFHLPKYLVEVLEVKKKVWLIREPAQGIGDKWQWIFLFGTNNPQWRDWKKERFYRVDSEEGRRILDTATFTKEEQASVYRHDAETEACVRQQNGGACDWCGAGVASIIYDPAEGAGRNRPDQLFHLCRRCHCQL